MLQKLKLAQKIPLGFGLLVVITLALSVLSLVDMRRIEMDADHLSTQYAPEVDIMSGLERNTLQTMYHVLAYSMTGDKSYLEEVKEYRNLVDEHLHEGDSLANKVTDDPELTQSMQMVSQRDNAMDQMILETVEASRQIDEHRQALDNAASQFMEAATTLLDNQNRKNLNEINTGAGTGKLQERRKKILLLQDIINHGNDARIDTWKAQARRDPARLMDALANFDGVKEDMTELRKIIRHNDDIANLNTIDKETQQYKDTMLGLYDAWNQLAKLDKDRQDTGDSLLASVRRAASNSTDATLGIARGTSGIIDKASNALWFGSIAALLLGIAIALYLTRNIVPPLKVLTEGARAMGIGDVQMEGIDKTARDRVVKRQDELGDIGKSFRTLTGYMTERAEAARRIGEGDLDVDIEKASDVDLLSDAMIRMKTRLTTLISDMQAMYREQKAGDIEFMLTPDNYQGAFAEVASGYNEAVQLHIDNLLLILNILGQYADGKFEAQLKKLPGKQAIANELMDKLRDNLQRIADDTNSLVQTALAGDLKTRADASKHGGQFREIIEGINATLNAVIEPVQEAGKVLAYMAEGDLSHKMEGDYKGDHALIKESLNNTLASLNEILEQVQVSVEQVNSGAVQVSDASQSLSQGATEQASSLEEVSSSMNEIGSQVKLNADNATQANQLSTQARSSAESGDKSMENMLSAMEEIDEKSGQIQKIIKVIDEIAFQTNLLALNAAVEAARAGVHGKGFAVVAEEVRNLAQRSASAARETTELIEGNVASVKNGAQIAEGTASSLKEIVDGVTKVTDLINEIASASREQAVGVDQITQALGQIDQVTQSNTANAEESAAAAEELSGQANQLNQMLRRFVLVHNARQLASGRSAAPKQLSGNGGGNGSTHAKSVPVRASSTTIVDPEDVIRLDDAQFEGF